MHDEGEAVTNYEVIRYQWENQGYDIPYLPPRSSRMRMCIHMQHISTPTEHDDMMCVI